MAEEVLKRAERTLKEHLNCPICLDAYTDPKQLQCNHVYCRQCLVPLLVRDQQGKLGLTCPACRQVTPIPDRGVAGLQPAFNINRLLEIQASFRVCAPVATSEEALVGVTIDIPPKNPVRHCFEHPGEEMKLYCETCGKLVCYKCALKGGKHHDHEYNELDIAFEKYKEEITSSLEPMEKQVDIAMKALSQLDTRCGKIADQRAATEDSIHETCRRLREAVNVRESQLIDQLDQIAREKLKGLAVQRDQIETTLAQLYSCLHLMKKSLRQENEGDALMMSSNIPEQIKELTTPFQQDILKPNTEADIAFPTPADVSGVCRDWYLPDLFKCLLTDSRVEAGVVGVKSTAILEVINFEGKLCKVPIRLLECEITSEITGTKASCIAERNRQGQYKISYQPTIKGRHQLQIKADGQHIKGSPFSVAVKAPIEKLGTQVLTIRGVNPGRCVINQSRELVVTDMKEHCVAVFTPGGQKLRSFGTRGSSLGQFNIPLGLTLDGAGNILVADCFNHRIQKFTAQGQFLAAVGSLGSGPLQFSYPSDIAFNTRNQRLYVVEQGNQRIQILNSDLSIYAFSFGRKGHENGCFDCPDSVAFNSTGNVHVADRHNYRIQVFTAEGKFLRMFGRHGVRRGELDCPVGVAIDTSDMVYVSEINNNRVSVFTSEGQFVTSFGCKGDGPGEFIRPRGLVVDDCGVVYVCDCGNSRVQAF